MHDQMLFLIADDDAEDRELVRLAFEASGVSHELHFVADGEELLAYLSHQGDYADASSAPRPDLILLDLNMPRLDGHGVLRRMKQDPHIADIPVIVFTTSSAERDIEETYRLGAQSYIEKPFSFDEQVRLLREIERYWTTTSRLPETMT
tara:strand:+ start:108 stop:554 length:447 start_codon:yes stop_codon:yes gene_type:complete